MSISNKITVNTYYTRSINIERDLNSTEVVKSYIPTSRAIRTLDRVAESFNDDTNPRAWSLIGPYGSGKSSFSLYLSHVLGDPKSEATIAAFDLLSPYQQLLSDYKATTEQTKGFLKVLISGAPEPLSKRLMQGLADAAQEFWRDARGKKPEIINKLQEQATLSRIDGSQVIALLTELQKALEKKSKGILIVIDELGKFLEYEARHYDANDIFLLQSIAEHACKGSTVNVFLFVLLHQSFEQYAKGLGESLKKEWAKIQGRFEDIPFLEGTEQTLKVVAKAFDYNLQPSEVSEISQSVSAIVNILDEEKALPGVLSVEEAENLFTNCYPLHPVTALVLPYICQKVAQNERTLFSFLGSNEPFGLKKLISEFSAIGEWVMPHHIFDYFITNQPAALGDHITQRRWAEVMTAVDRLDDTADEQLNFLKTVGLFNIIGAQSGLKASKLILTSLFGETEVQTLAKALEDKAVLQFRKFNAEYRVWQGSDFDLETAVQEELAVLGKFSLAEALNKRAELPPIVARRYTIETGTLRYFTPTFIDAQTYKKTIKSDIKPRIIFFLATAKDDKDVFNDSVKTYFGELDFVVLCMNAPQLKEATAEVEALNRVRISRQELNNDNVAYKEFSVRFDAAIKVEGELLKSLLDNPQRLDWFYGADQLEINNKRQLQESLSGRLKSIYSKLPIIKNELINRDSPSPPAVAARGKLLAAMLQNSRMEELGFEKNPPEKAIYRSFVKAVGIHRQLDNGEYVITEPSLDEATDPLNFRHVWLRVKSFIESTQEKAKPLTELEQELTRPPYGLKAGLLPIIYVSALLVYKDELAVYCLRQYKPDLALEDIERFIKRPDEYTVQYFKLEGLKESIFSQYNQALFGLDGTKTETGEDRKLLSLAKPLAKFIEGDLPDYTKQTKNILPDALRLRDAVKYSKSPLALIFKEIPVALGFKELDETDESIAAIAGLSQKLTDALRELKHTYAGLLQKEQELLAQALGFSTELSLKELRKRIYGKIFDLASFTIDEVGVKAFIRRLTNKLDSDENWLESVLLFLGHKPSKKWTDKDRNIAEYRLNQFSRQILDLQSLCLQYDKNHKQGDNDFDVVLLKTVKKGQGELDTVVTIDKQTAGIIADAKVQIVTALDELPDKESKLAALADLVNEYLLEYNTTNTKESDINHDLAKGA